MRTFLAAVLSVIAVGVLLIAYGLLAPRAIAAPGMVDNGGVVTLDPNRYPTYAAQPLYSTAQPVYASDRVAYATQPAAAQHVVYLTQPAPAPRRVVTTRVDRGRDWKNTALVIGGSTAAGAGVGGAFGGRNGALIGAAIGGGASTLFEAVHK